MGVTLALIKSYVRQRHPLGKPITWEEVPQLIEELRSRLNATSEVLDLSPLSLKQLESHLIKYNGSIQKQGEHLADEDLVNFVREITAYLGYVLVLHSEGYWYTEAIHLLDTRVKFNEPWEIIDDEGSDRYISTNVNFMIGREAVWAWDTIVSGGKPNLYRMYLDAKSKSLRERL